MIERYTIKFAPAVSPKDMLKWLKDVKDGDTAALAKLQQSKVKIEVLCEAADFKKLSELLKNPSMRL